MKYINSFIDFIIEYNLLLAYKFAYLCFNVLIDLKFQVSNNFECMISNQLVSYGLFKGVRASTELSISLIPRVLVWSFVQVALYFILPTGCRHTNVEFKCNGSNIISYYMNRNLALLILDWFLLKAFRVLGVFLCMNLIYYRTSNQRSLADLTSPIMISAILIYAATILLTSLLNLFSKKANSTLQSVYQSDRIKFMIFRFGLISWVWFYLFIYLFYFL